MAETGTTGAAPYPATALAGGAILLERALLALLLLRTRGPTCQYDRRPDDAAQRPVYLANRHGRTPALTSRSVDGVAEKPTADKIEPQWMRGIGFAVRQSLDIRVQMQDSLDLPTPSTLKPILYGAVFGGGAIAIFLLAYVIAPDLGLAGTLAIAAGLMVLATLLLNAVMARASGEIAALARGEEVPASAVEMEVHAVVGSAGNLRLEEWEARVTELRQQTDAIDRATQRTEWLESARALADEVKGLATEEMSIPGRKHRRSSLGRFRQAANIYRRLTTARGAVRDRDWGVAQIALGECLLVLGEAEGARDEVMEAANAFAAGLEIADLSAEERRAGDNALAQAEGVLASMADASRNSGGDDLF